MERHFRSVLLVFVLLLLQTTFIPLLALGGVVPDLLLIWVVFTALRRGQVEAMLAGFIVGLSQDLLATQLFGLAAMTKTIAGFFAGYFFNENKTDQTLGTYRFLLVIGSSSIIHNVVYYTIFLQGTDASLPLAVVQISLAVTAYTIAVGALPMFTFSRRLAT